MSGRSVWPQRDLALYERLISQGIASADRHGRAIDHVTARRLSLWLLPRSSDEPDFMRELIRFAKTGALSKELRAELRYRARSPSHPNRPHAARLLQYLVARGESRGPIGDDFAAICDQIDSADEMLLDLRDRARGATEHPEPVGHQHQHPIAMARYDPASRTYGFIFDADTAKAAIHAITLNPLDREARTREVEHERLDFPRQSYGRRNREAIASREARTASRLRAIERAYRTAADPDTTRALELTKPLPSADNVLDLEIEAE